MSAFKCSALMTITVILPFRWSPERGWSFPRYLWEALRRRRWPQCGHFDRSSSPSIRSKLAPVETCAENVIAKLLLSNNSLTPLDFETTSSCNMKCFKCEIQKNGVLWNFRNDIFEMFLDWNFRKNLEKMPRVWNFRNLNKSFIYWF